MSAAWHHLRAFNRGAWEQAEQHRFWQPETTPRGVDDRRPATPISAELFPGYEPKSSARLDAALAWIRRRLLEEQTGVEDRAVVTAWMEQTGRGLRVIPVRHADEHAAAFSGFVL